MSYLVPRSFWSFPQMNLPSLLDEGSDWGMISNVPSGLSLSEDDKSVYVEAAVPGVDPENVDITFEKGVVKISATGKSEEKEGRKVWKRSQSEFTYQFSLPADVNTDADPEAQIENGVVHLTFPKSAKAQPRKISIKK